MRVAARWRARSGASRLQAPGCRRTWGTTMSRPLKQALRDPLPDEATMRRMWSGVVKRGAPARKRWLAIPVLAVGVIAVILWVKRPAGPIRLADLTPLDRMEHSVALDDGSRITLEPGAVLEPLENDGARLGLFLKSGKVRFEVRPKGPRRWIVDAGLATVEVVGTVF